MGKASAAIAQRQAHRAAARRLSMRSLLLAAALLVVGTASAQTPDQSLESRATELRDGLTVLISMAHQADQRAVEATRRLALVRVAMAGDAAPVEPRAAVAAPQKLKADAPTPAPPVSVWDFSPVVAALIQSMLLAIGTLTPVVIAWAVWEFRKRTGVIAQQQDATVLSNAVKNSVGAMEHQAAINGVLPDPLVAKTYVLLHAGDEAHSLGIKEPAITEKIAAQMGLQALSLKAASAATPVYTILPPTS